MAAYAVDTNKVFAISRERLAKSKCQPSPEWKRLDYLCKTNEVKLVKNTSTGTYDIKLTKKI